MLIFASSDIKICVTYKITETFVSDNVVIIFYILLFTEIIMYVFNNIEVM